MTRIIVFAKAPVPGRVKTRLIPVLGEAGAAQLAARMLRDTIQEAKDAGIGAVELCADPPPDHPDWHEYVPHGVVLTAQGDGDLGERLARAAERATAAGERLLLIGTDCPELLAAPLREAALSLERHEAVLYPAQDGGYVLLGLKRSHASLFRGIAWSTNRVAAQTRERLAALGWSVDIGPTFRDVDEPADLR